MSARTLDPAALLRCAEDLRTVLRAAGFTHGGVQERLGVGAGGFADLSSPPLVLWRSRGDEPIDTLVRLFVAGADVPVEAAKSALGSAFPSAVASGLLQNSQTGLQAALALVPFEDVVTAADFSLRPSGPVAPDPDHVMGVGRSSASLGRVALPLVSAGSSSASVLDLGCGGGYFALRAARMGRRAVGTDINARAISLARFNAALNGCSADFRCGNLFEPVAAETFDVILSNPPFVISPETGLVYRDGAAEPSQVTGQKRWGDEFCSTIAGSGPDHLAPGGTLVMLFNAAADGPDAWSDRVRRWVPPSSQAIALKTDVQRTDEYASMWIRHTASGRSDWSPEMFARTFERWMRYYESSGISHIAYGLLAVRRSEPAFFDAVDVDSRWIDAGAIDLARLFEGRAILAALPSDDHQRRLAMIERRWSLADDVQVVRTTTMTPRSSVSRDGVTIAGSMGRPVAAVAPAVADVILRCSGTRTLGALVAEAAAVTGAERAELTEGVARALLVLMREGVLRPA